MLFFPYIIGRELFLIVLNCVYIVVSSKLFHARTKHGLTQQKVAESVSVSERWYQRLEKGENLPSDFIIHVVVPCVDGVVTDENKIELKMSYLNVLECVRNNMARIVVLPCLGTGSNGFPKDVAANIAVEAINEFLSKYESEIDKIIIDVFDDESYDIYSKLLIGEVDA